MCSVRSIMSHKMMNNCFVYRLMGKLVFIFKHLEMMFISFQVGIFLCYSASQRLKNCGNAVPLRYMRCTRNGCCFVCGINYFDAPQQNKGGISYNKLR